MRKTAPYIKQIINIIVKGQTAFLLLLFLLSTPKSVYSQAKNEDDLKKEALKAFEDEDYARAYKMYSQLVSLYPKDPDYNYHLGVCMLYIEPDKKKPFSYLQIAVNNPKDAPKDAKFFLAKAYHYNYRFDDALKLYNEYKQNASSSSIKKYQVDREIEACKSGKRLLSNLSDLVIMEKKQLNELDYFRSYNLSDIGGKLLVKPEDFKSSLDKKKKEKSVIYMPKNGERIYYSSYGDKGDRGRDIYYVNRLPNGEWSKPQILPASINTEFDEDYPFLHPNGKTLYFCSKGHNSMGGYDIFKTTFDDQTNSWSKPVNMDFPINSPDDDILFVTDSLEKIAYFSSGRYSPYGKLDVMKINTERRPMDIAVIKGTVVKEDVNQSVKSKITVKNIANGEIVGTYQAQDNGDYYMELPNGGKFIFTVETPGIQTQSEGVQIPLSYSLKPFKQVISYDKKILKIINYFDGQITDDNYSMYLDLIEKKAKLEVNENEPYNNSLINGQSNPDNNLSSVSTNNPTINPEKTTNNEPDQTNKNISNEQLLELAKEDLKEATEEAQKLKKEAQDAMSFVTTKNQEAQEKQKQADEALTNANTLTDPNKKNEELEKAKELKEEAKQAANVANTASNLAKKLEVDAEMQQKEADISAQYVKELEAVTKNKNNKEALAKLEQLQKQLDDIAKQKNQSDELFTSLKAEAELKQNELKKEEEKYQTAQNEINTLKDEVKSIEKEMAAEKDQSLKENMAAQIRELNTDIEAKNKELTPTTQKINRLKNEVDGVNQELEVAAKMLNEKVDVVSVDNNPTDENKFDGAVSSNTTSTSGNENNSNQPENSSSITSFTDLNNKYSEKVKTIDKTTNNTDEIKQQNNLLTDYNQDIMTLLASDKEALAKTKKSDEKKKLNDEIKKLEQQKSDNDQLLSANNTKLSQQENLAVNNPTTTATENNSVNPENNSVTTSNNDPVSAKYVNDLEDLKNKINQNANQASELMAYNNYKETSSLNLKKEAEQKFDQAKKDEEALVQMINQAQNTIKTQKQSNADILSNEADELNKQAYTLRKQASSQSEPEKENTIKQAVQLENQATSKKIQAFELTAGKNQQEFDHNQQDIDALSKLTGNKNNEDISQANLLIAEAQINYNQAQKMRQEAAQYPSEASKLGGYSNAEDKENEALMKQKKAIDLLIKNNPSYQRKNVSGSSDPETIVSNVANELNKTSDTQIDAYLTLSKANQNELKLQGEKLTKNPALNKPENKNAKDLKVKSDGFKNEAMALVGKALSTTNRKDKSELLLQANQKELESLKALNEAQDILSGTSVVAINNNPENNNINSSENNSDNNPNNSTKRTNEQNNNENTEPNNASVNTNTVSNNQNNDNNNVAVNSNPVSNNGNHDNLAVNSNTTVPSSIINEQKDEVSKLTKEADSYNNEAATLRKTASGKSGTEKENLISQAKELENKAIAKKTEASVIQKTVNQETFENNRANINELADLTNDPKLPESSNIQKLLSEATVLTKKAEDLRKEADNNPSPAAKLGGYDNAEEKEAEALAKQEQVLAIYKKYNPDYVYKDFSQNDNNITATNNNPSNNPNENNPVSNNNNVSENNNVENQNENKVSENNPSVVSVEELQKQYPEQVNETKNNQQSYKNQFLSLPANLSTEQQDLKLQAQAAYKKSQSLMDEATKTTDPQAQKRLLSEADQSSQEAIQFLSKIKEPAVATNLSNNGNQNLQNGNNSEAVTNNNGNNSDPNSNRRNSNPGENNNLNNNGNNGNNVVNNNPNNNNTNPNISENNVVGPPEVKIVAEGIEIKNNNAYSANNPIPIDEKMPEGLIFKVQVGAFKNPLPNDQFKGLAPVVGQTTPNGYIRYMAGNFEKYESANAVKNDLRRLGYKDAFVVAYLNGKRITLSEATSQLQEKGQTPDLALNTTAGISENSNVPKSNFVTNPAVNNTPNPTNNNVINSEANQPVVTQELEKKNGLLYTVQIGVFSNQTTQAQLFNLSPIYTEKLPNGLYRYTAGIYNQGQRVIEDKRKVVSLGVKDAFVSAYYNSKRIPYAEAQRIQSENSNLQMETENPIVFPGTSTSSGSANTNTSTAANTNSNNTEGTPSVQPFNNGVNKGPEPTAENGVKVGEEGISFKVQIGAYKNQVPNEVAAKFLNIKTWPVENKVVNGLYIYTVGNFIDAKFAKALKDEAVSVGITDAFIVVFKDGKKLYGAEASQYLGR